MSVLAIGAHPDDIEIGCGATLHRQAKAGAEITVLILTRGERSRGISFPNERMQESEKALAMLGIARDNVFFGSGQDTLLHLDRAKMGRDIADIAASMRPSVILVPGRDLHQDHQVAREAAIVATRSMPFPVAILGYETASGAQDGFKPNWYEVIFKGILDLKIASLACHRSQTEKAYMTRAYHEARARFRAEEAGISGGLVEAFEVVRVVREGWLW